MGSAEHVPHALEEALLARVGVRLEIGGLPPLFQDVQLFRAQFLRSPDVEVDEEIALAVAVHGGQPLALQAQDLPALGARLDPDLGLALQEGDLDLGTERGFHEGDIVVEVEVAVVADSPHKVVAAAGGSPVACSSPAA